MTWYPDDDDFPLAWLEATAVLMEGLGFHFIPDYLQYTRYFFSHPLMSFLDPNANDMTVYTNSLLTKFMYEKGVGADRIDLIKTIFFNNYRTYTLFGPNLRTSSLSLGSPWVGILNRFHAGSYYTGSRADTSLFIADAPLLNQWTCFLDSFPSTYAITKPMSPYGMQVFNLAPGPGDGDTLLAILNCQKAVGDTVPYPYWGSTCIIKRPQRPDSLFTLSIDPSGQARYLINNWRKAGDTMLLIVTNGHPSDTLSATMSALACPVRYHRGDSLVFNDTLSEQSATTPPDKIVFVDLVARSNLNCPLTTNAIKPSALPTPPKTVLVSGFAGLNYPAEFWGSNASVGMTFFVRSSYLASINKHYIVNNDSVALWQFDNILKTWHKLQSIAGSLPGGATWRFPQAGPGTYALFASELTALDTSRMMIAPNPARLSAKKGMFFEGGGISEVRIYTAGGSLVCNSRDTLSSAFQRYSGGMVWQLVNGRGAAVAPGYYTALTIQTDAATGGKTSKLNKVLVFP
jgi:hypothetical protein